MKKYTLPIIVSIFLIPSISFAQTKDNNIIKVHPTLDEKTVENEVVPLIQSMVIKRLEQDQQLKTQNKKLESLNKQLEALQEKENKRAASYVQCWSGCPGVNYYGGNDYRCYDKNCSQCGQNCNKRFGNAKADIEAQEARIEDQMDSVDQTINGLEEAITKDYAGENTIEALRSVNLCVNGVINGKAVYQDRTYTTLDDCLKAHGWKRSSK